MRFPRSGVIFIFGPFILSQQTLPYPGTEINIRLRIDRGGAFTKVLGEDTERGGKVYGEVLNGEV